MDFETFTVLVREQSHSNVNFVVHIFPERVALEITLHQYMTEKHHLNVMCVVLFLHETKLTKTK